MGKVSKQQKDEYRYKRFKKALVEFNVVPDDPDEARMVCAQLRKAVRVKHYCIGFAGIVTGILTLIMIVGFLILPVGILCIWEGRREVRRINRYEARYIQEQFPDAAL